MKEIKFGYHRLRVRFFAHADLSLEGWIGAVLRNNFLVQAAAVKDKMDISLFEYLNCFPLPKTHPAYKALQGGFQKALWFDFREIPVNNRSHILRANQIYVLTIVMVDSFLIHFPMVAEALRRMFNRGFGHPVVPATLVDISDCDAEDHWRLCYQPDTGVLHMPMHAIHLSDFQLADCAPSVATVQIYFNTPVNLFRQRAKKDSEQSFQDKLNGFPSFYQLVRSLAYRVSTLDLLYGDPIGEGGWSKTEIETSVRIACEAQLLQVNLRNCKVRGTPKQGNSHVYVMEGYQGRLILQQVPSVCLPLLAFGMGLLVGNQVQYGLGAYTLTLL